MECTYIGKSATGKTPGPARTSLKRQNVCDPCEKSKFRCDQTRPSCGRCSRLGKSSQCSYPHGPRQGGETRSSGQEFDADQRSELAEDDVRFNKFGDQSLGTDQPRYRPLVLLSKALSRRTQHWLGIGNRKLQVTQVNRMIYWTHFLGRDLSRTVLLTAGSQCYPSRLIAYPQTG